MSYAESMSEGTASLSQLYFLYNSLSMKLLFSNIPLQEYFSDDTHLIPGKNTITPDPLAEYHWQQALLLQKDERYTYTVPSLAHPEITYQFNIQSVQPFNTNDESIIACEVKKNISNSSARPVAVKPPDYKKEYAEFISLAVHDLESPVRKLSVMLEKIGENTGDESPSLGYLQRAQRILAEMNAQIESLGALATLEHSVLKIEQVDLNVVVEKLRDDFKSAAAITLGNLPTVMGDPDLLSALFRHLIENSIKFGRQGVPVEIMIAGVNSSAPNNDSGIAAGVTITDNGIGLPEAMKERIFQPFVRLHGKSEYPGPGMGLAIARKIAELHKGTLVAEPAEEVGARFILILPQTSR